jgi:magnesium-transporting ATPase (P-type)
MSETSHLLSHENKSAELELISALHEAKLDEIYLYFESSRWGLTSEEARRSRQTNGLNTIPAPIAAPAWLCCLLPCLLKTKSMEQYHECVPEFAFVMRNKRWVKMDSASIVPGDLIRVEAGGEILLSQSYFLITCIGWLILPVKFVSTTASPLGTSHSSCLVFPCFVLFCFA